MKKSDMPKPKFGLGDVVIYVSNGDGEYHQAQRKIGTVTEVEIVMNQKFTRIRYIVDADAGLIVEEAAITRRAIKV